MREPPRKPVAIEPRGDRAAPLVFKQGAHPPYAIRWYGITSLFGHFRNFIASAIASESVDSRDWMRPLEARDVLANALRVLGDERIATAAPAAATLLDGVGRPLWLDFVADTGDDRDVSQAVARMVFSEIAVREDDGAELVLPRGDVLLFGGDTAYPVATAEEIHRRVTSPWNEVLREAGVSDGRRRVLLGIPGNHDWYDGLDGFGRFFRKRPAGVHVEPSSGDAESRAERRKARRGRKVGLVLRGLHLDEVGGFFRLLADAWLSVSAFFRGTKVARRRHLGLDGYEAVQESSFWALPLAPGLDLWGVDRQLGRLDFRQRRYFVDRHKAIGDARIVFIAPDPAIALGESYPPGARMLAACKLSFERDRVLYLCGDMHHYERRELGRSKQVIAGGGGAFLHGTLIPRIGEPAARAYPDAATSRKLVLQMPLHLMLGRAGYLVHVGLALLASIELGAGAVSLFRLSSLLLTVGLAVGLTGIAGQKKGHGAQVLGIAVPFAIALGLMPWGLLRILHAVPIVGTRLERDTFVLLVYPFLGALVFGIFLAVVAILGLESQQAFTVLGHPGFKHFVRLRVSPDGRLDAWVIGKDDPLGAAGPWLIDRWSWDAARETRDAKPAA
jgi:hypothetical protein